MSCNNVIVMNLDIPKSDLQYYKDKEEGLNAKMQAQEKNIGELTIEKHTYKIQLASLKRENYNLEGEYKDLILKIYQLMANKGTVNLGHELKDKIEYSRLINNQSDKYFGIQHYKQQNLEELEKQKLNLIQLIEANKAEIDRHNKNTQ